MAKILIPIPVSDFDPTEVAVPWKILTEAGHQVTFSTPNGSTGQADPIMVTGIGLGPFQSLKADERGREAYASLIKSSAFKAPMKWSECDSSSFDAIVLPGGHAPGMKEYLESAKLQGLVSEFFGSSKLIGAICHGVVLASRAKIDNRSVLYGRKTTALPAWMELSAWGLTATWMRNYYRTYPITVQREVTRSLSQKSDFLRGPMSLKRDSPESLESGFVVRDKNYVSARWPGDAHRFANELIQALKVN